jgi:hypothetical protein
MINAITRARCETLRDFLYQVPTETPFDMSSWVGNDEVPWGGDPDLSCGTSACAVGLGTTIPAFRAAGLRLVQNDEGGSVEYEDENGNVFVSFSAVSMFFGLKFLKTTYWLFSDYEYFYDNITPSLVADRLDYVLKHGEETTYNPNYCKDRSANA